MYILANSHFTFFFLILRYSFHIPHILKYRTILSAQIYHYTPSCSCCVWKMIKLISSLDTQIIQIKDNSYISDIHLRTINISCDLVIDKM